MKMNGHTDDSDDMTLPLPLDRKKDELPDAKIERLLKLIPGDFLEYGTPQYITSGSSGVLFQIGKDHILKVIDCAMDPILRQAAEHEIRIMEQLKDLKGTVQLVRSRCREGEPVFILETRHMPLRDYIKTHPFSDAEALELGVQMCNILAELRDRGIFHLDIFPFPLI